MGFKICWHYRHYIGSVYRSYFTIIQEGFLMKKTIFVLSFLFFIFWYGTALSYDRHYTATGDVETTSLSELIQLGTINLQLYDGEEKVFDETGNLIGIITGSSENEVYLMHMAIFEDGSLFITDGDIAFYTGVDGDNTCSLLTTELITKIVIGRGFFRKIGEANIMAEGTVDYCDNQNGFQLSGDLWFK